jgi:hypothetical protein
MHLFCRRSDRSHENGLPLANRVPASDAKHASLCRRSNQAHALGLPLAIVGNCRQCEPWFAFAARQLLRMRSFGQS